MLLQVPLSVGEVLDKITILEIKSERIGDADKLKNIHNELNALRPLVDGEPFNSDEITALFAELKSINEELWVIEDDIREQEGKRDFGQRFIDLARAVYATNDRRADVKKRINLATGSDLVEEKSYEDYSGDA